MFCFNTFLSLLLNELPNRFVARVYYAPPAYLVPATAVHAVEGGLDFTKHFQAPPDPYRLFAGPEKGHDPSLDA